MNALEQLTDAQTVLSTSTGITFPPPPLLTRLAQEEEKVVSAKGQSIPHRLAISGDEKVGLKSILGWSGSDHVAQMIGNAGFVRHQAVTVLYSESLRSLGPLPDDHSASLEEVRIYFSTCTR